MKIILTVIGARPQFIKASVLSRLFLKASISNLKTHFAVYENGVCVFFEEMQKFVS